MARRTLVAVGLAAAIGALLLFVWYAREVLLLAFAGVLIALALRTAATWTARVTRLPVAVALAAVVLLLLGTLVTVGWWRGPTIAEEVRALQESLRRAVTELRGRLAATAWGQPIAEAVDDLPSAEALLPDARDAVSQATGVVSRTVSALGSLAVILFLGLVFAASPGVYVRGLLALVPAAREPRAHAVLRTVAHTLRWWLLGRLISMTVIGVATGVGLALLDVPLALVLALLAALLSFIPNVGPILSAVPAVLLALAAGPRQALWVVLLYVGIQAVESWVLDPFLDKKTVALPPALTVLVQLVLAIAAGLLGAALAAPLAAAGVVLVTMLYVHDVLGRHDVQLPVH